MAYQIRTYGDPVLKTKAAEVTDINGKIARLVDDMFDTLYDSDSGIALAAPQIGVQKQIFVWDVDGLAVHVTAATEPAFGVSRIGPVYTPGDRRGHGYASRAVYEVSKQLVDSGVRACLFTDQANPTSNKIYEALGYERVVDMANLLVRVSGAGRSLLAPGPHGAYNTPGASARNQMDLSQRFPFPRGVSRCCNSRFSAVPRSPPTAA